MIKLRVDDETAIPLSVDSSSAVSMTVSEAFIDRGGAAIQNNKNAAPSTSQVVVTPDEGFDGMAKVTVAAMPQGEIDPASLSYDTYLLRGRITAQADVTQAGYVPTGANMAMKYCDELLPSENPKTVTPTTSEQIAVYQNKWTKGQIKVGPIPPEYIVPTGTKQITSNGSAQDVAAYEKVDVNVPASAVDSGTKNISSNGTHNVVGYASANVNVPNSYSASDEGKVVHNGALTTQTSGTATENGTVDTTLINSLLVNVGGGGAHVASGTFTITAEANDNAPTITHNLNTQKIAVLIYPTSAKISTGDGYRNWYAELITVNQIENGNTWTFNWTSYNSHFSGDEVVTLPDGNLRIGVIHQSPWATQSHWYDAGNPAFITGLDSIELTDNTVRVRGTSNRRRWCCGTYNWIVAKME